MIEIDLIKQQELDTYPTAIQQINFTRHLDRLGNTKKFFIIEGSIEMLLVILMMKIISHIKFYQLINKFQSFVKLLKIILQIIKNYRRTQLHEIGQFG